MSILAKLIFLLASLLIVLGIWIYEDSVALKLIGTGLLVLLLLILYQLYYSIKRR